MRIITQLIWGLVSCTFLFEFTNYNNSVVLASSWTTADSIALHTRYNRHAIPNNGKYQSLCHTKLCVISLIARGGGGYYENNPYYVPPLRQTKPLTLGDLDDNDYHENKSNARVNQQEQNKFGVSDYKTSNLFKASSLKHYNCRHNLKQISNQVKGFIQSFHQLHPLLSIIAWCSIVIFVLWQMCVILPAQQSQILSRFLRNYFVCNIGNVSNIYYWPSIILSSISHSSLIHILFNLIAFLSTGPKVQEVLRRSSCPWPVWPLLLGSALSGSIMYLILTPKSSGGCMGLSAVTFSLMALYAQFFPQRIISLLLFGIFPVRMAAGQLLQVALLWSSICSVMVIIMPASAPSTTLAHSAHLGGLLFGIFYYNMWQRGKSLRARKGYMV